jgi:hypothetical protein
LAAASGTLVHTTRVVVHRAVNLQQQQQSRHRRVLRAGCLPPTALLSAMIKRDVRRKDVSSAMINA